jgi:hypothetical protein
MNDGSAIANGSANSLADAGETLRRSTYAPVSRSTTADAAIWQILSIKANIQR